MAETITMPDLGFEAGGGELSVWLKSVGDSIEAGEPIAEIESDKVTLEVESPAAGVLLELLIEPGQNAAVGAPLAKVGAADELPSPPTQEAAAAAREERREENDNDLGSGETLQPQAPPLAPPLELPAVEPLQDGVMATPIARRIAQEHNLNLRRIAASGPGGRILRADVETYLAQSRAGSTATADPSTEREDEADDLAATARPLQRRQEFAGSAAASPLRRAIAQRMGLSKQTIPHFYITNSVTMDDALALRKQINEALPQDEQVTVNDLVMKAAALALRDFPNLNASYADDRIVSHPEIHIGAAVAVDGGVLTVVNRQTDRRTISEIARANRAMIQRARAGRVKPQDVTGSTFTISNLGGYDTDHFAAIINPPEAAILAVATARETAVVVAGQVEVRKVMQMTISADHRVTDGAECALFLQKVKSLLETPIKVLLE